MTEERFQKEELNPSQNKTYPRVLVSTLKPESFLAISLEIKDTTEKK